MKFNFQNSLVSEEEIKKTGETLSEYVKHLRDVSAAEDYEADESSICLGSDSQISEKVVKLKSEKVTGNLKYIIDIGIGGSNLGTKALYDAKFGYFDILEPERFPKMVFVDTCDPEFLSKIGKFISRNIKSADEILVNVISKSGTTTETIANFEIILEFFKANFPNILERVVVTTDKDSKLWNAAEEKDISCLEIPKKVGGRYSIFSAVGIFPLACGQINVDKLRAGAINIREKCLNENVLENPALVSAVILYLNFKSGKNINDNFFFHPELESLGKWYRQLMGESVGKEKNLDGETVNIGITPTVSLGSTDLHSVGQLYLGGPKDKITTFVSAENTENIPLPENLLFPDLVESIKGKSAKQIMEAILEGVKIAYQKKDLPFMEIILDNLSEEALGEFLQFKMIEIMYLGKLLNVNSFDQPNVEDYKVETRKILAS